MKIYLYYFSLIFLLAAPAEFANATAGEEIAKAHSVKSATVLAAGNCATQANVLASSYANATILSVTDNGNSCTIVIRVKDANGGRSRIIKKTVSG